MSFITYTTSVWTLKYLLGETNIITICLKGWTCEKVVQPKLSSISSTNFSWSCKLKIIFSLAASLPHFLSSTRAFITRSRNLDGVSPCTCFMRCAGVSGGGGGGGGGGGNGVDKMQLFLAGGNPSSLSWNSSVSISRTSSEENNAVPWRISLNLWLLLRSALMTSAEGRGWRGFSYHENMRAISFLKKRGGKCHL